MTIIFTEHATFEMERRKILKENVENVIKSPQQKIKSRKKRVILQNKFFDRVQQKEMLLRVIGKESKEKFIIITAYKTSKIEKYLQKGGGEG